MDERDSHCPYLLSSETTAKGTGLAESAGKEDPVELDSSGKHTHAFIHVINMRLGFIHFMNAPIDNVYEGMGVLTGTYRNPVLELSANSKWHSLQLKATLAIRSRLLKIKKMVVYRHGKGFKGSGIFHLQDHRYSLDLALGGHGSRNPLRSV